MLAFQLAEIILEFFFLNTILNIREFWYVILQPLPLFVVLVLFVASNLKNQRGGTLKETRRL